MNEPLAQQVCVVCLCPVGEAGGGVGRRQPGLHHLAQTEVSVGGGLHVVAEFIR